MSSLLDQRLELLIQRRDALQLYIPNRADGTNKIIFVEGDGACATEIKNEKHIVEGNGCCTTAFQKIRL
jgi:hypothetical protein